MFICISAIVQIKERLSTVKHKVLVLSGKGGVGKSTFSAHLAHGLASDSKNQVVNTSQLSVIASVLCVYSLEDIKVK